MRSKTITNLNTVHHHLCMNTFTNNLRKHPVETIVDTLCFHICACIRMSLYVGICTRVYSPTSAYTNAYMISYAHECNIPYSNILGPRPGSGAVWHNTFMQSDRINVFGGPQQYKAPREIPQLNCCNHTRRVLMG